MLRPYNGGVIHVVVLLLNLSGGYFFAAFRAHVFVFTQRDFESGEQLLFVKTEALAVGDVAYVSAKFSVGPEEIADGAEKIFNFVVALDQFSDVTGGARRANVIERLRRLRIEAHARH